LRLSSTAATTVWLRPLELRALGLRERVERLELAEGREPLLFRAELVLFWGLAVLGTGSS
jgi:hypothetical protein